MGGRECGGEGFCDEGIMKNKTNPLWKNAPYRLETIALGKRGWRKKIVTKMPRAIRSRPHFVCHPALRSEWERLIEKK